MPESVEIYNVAVCSPSGLAEDREAVARAVETVNEYVAHESFQMRARRWERDVRPSVGSDGQDVVNEQIIDTADLGIVLLGDRLGHATPRAESGTAEEAERLLARRSSGENVDLLVFFRRSTAELTESYLAELARVIAFRERLRAAGVFWNEYSTSEELSELVKLHLPRAVRTLHERSPSSRADSSDRAEINSGSDGLEPDANEVAAIDLEIEFLDAIDEFTGILGDLTNGAEVLSQGMTDLTAKLEKAATSPIRDPRKIRPLVNESARVLNAQSEVVESGLPRLKETTRVITESTLAMAGMIGAEVTATPEDVAALIGAVEGLRTAVSGAIESTQAQADSVGEFPRMTREVNQARNRYVKCNSKLLAVLRTFETSLDRIVTDLQAR